MKDASPAPLRIVLADDHDLVRSGIAALLSSIQGVQVIAQARDGEELLQILQTVQPEIVITDIGMPGLDGYAAARRIALRSVMHSGSYFGHGVAQLLLRAGEPEVAELLTERQVEVLTRIAQGRSAKEIAFELGLSSKTVDVHRNKIMERLDLHDIASLTRYAVRKGLVKD